MKIDGCSALITGGASGLGLACVRSLHEAGAFVVLLDLPGAPGDEIAAALGDRARFVAGDVTSAGNVQAGPIAAMDMASRFRWLTAKRSTVVQTSMVHPGLCKDPLTTLIRLHEQLVIC